MAIAYVTATAGATDATGAWSYTTTAPSAAGNLIIVQVFQDATSSNTAISITSATNVEDLAGTDSVFTALAATGYDVGNTVQGYQYIFIGRALNTSAIVITGANTSADDIYIRAYEFSGVAKGTTLSAVIENATAGTATNGKGTSTTCSDTSVQTLGDGRLALNFVAIGIFVTLSGLAAFAGMTGGTWALATAIYETTTGTDGCIGLMSASMASAGTIDGGSDTITSYPWGVIGFALIPELSPTVALNTPTDTATGVSTTPDLVFTGTDGNADTIEYNVQVDTANTFDSQIGSGPTYDTSVTANGNGVNSFAFGALTTAAANEVLIATLDFSNTTPSGVTFDGSLTWTKLGTEITKPNSGGEVYHYWALAPSVLSSVTFTATFTGGGFPQASGVISAYGNVDTTSPIGDHQTGTANATTAVSATVTTTRNNSLVVAGTGQTGNNAFSAGTGETIATQVQGGTVSRTVSSYQNSVTANSSTSVTMDITIGANDDMGMRAIELKTTALPLINKLSVTPDATFTDVTDGTDTHPFDSTDQIKYTVQAGNTLTASTLYYWRVAGTDPSGSNTYGAWATTRSFTTTSGVAAIPNKIYQTRQSIKRSSYY